MNSKPKNTQLPEIIPIKIAKLDQTAPINDSPQIAAVLYSKREKQFLQYILSE